MWGVLMLDQFTTSYCALRRYSVETYQKALLEVFAEKYYIDMIFQTLDEQELVEQFSLQNIAEQYVLYKNTPFDGLKAYSPQICRINTPGNAFLSYILTRKPGWGFISASKAPFVQVVSHWQNLLEAELPDGRKTHLRIYDGDIMSKLLPACSEGELRRLMGPCAMLYVQETDIEHQWLQIMHPALAKMDVDEFAKSWPKDNPDSIWKMQPQHFLPFASEMEKVHVANMQQMLLEEDAVIALQLDAKYEGLAGFVEEVIAEAKTLKVTENPEVEEYLLLRFYYALIPKKTEQLRLAMQNSFLSASHRLTTAHHFLKVEMP